MNFEINLVFLIRQKLKYLEDEKNFSDKIKNIFHHFGLLIKQVTQIFLEVRARLVKNI